ncbi:MAG: cytochrome c-type biogenesis protein CcmH [Solirubrobacteraceae bacterium]
MTRRAPIVGALLLMGWLAAAMSLGATAQAATTPKASYLQVVDDVMCVVCHEPLGVAQSPEAFQERNYIRQLIVQGKTRKEIEDDLVQQYGPAVLSRPPANGVNLLVYVVPPVVVVAGIVLVAIFIPGWRRRARQSGADTTSPGAALDPADAERLNEDLGRFA